MKRIAAACGLIVCVACSTHSTMAPTAAPTATVTCTLEVQHVDNLTMNGLGRWRITWQYTFRGVSTATLTARATTYTLPGSPGTLTLDYPFPAPDQPDITTTLRAGMCTRTVTTF